MRAAANLIDWFHDAKCLSITLIRYILKKKIPTRDYLPYLLTVMGRHEKAAEIGVLEGAFSEKILKYCAMGILYSIDPWKEFDKEVYNDGANLFQEEQEKRCRTASERLRKYGKRSKILRMTSREASALFEVETLDFIYIDANHSYDFCKEDMGIWWPKLKYGGIFAGHDYKDDSALNWGVKKAVDEFVGKYKQKLFVTFEYSPTWYIIKEI